jgi:hypothetical protein
MVPGAGGGLHAEPSASRSVLGADRAGPAGEALSRPWSPHADPEHAVGGVDSAIVVEAWACLAVLVCASATNLRLGHQIVGGDLDVLG